MLWKRQRVQLGRGMTGFDRLTQMGEPSENFFGLFGFLEQLFVGVSVDSILRSLRLKKGSRLGSSTGLEYGIAGTANNK